MGTHDRTEAASAVNAAIAFTDVYDAHVHEVYRFVHRRCRDHALAEDITQETFMAAARKPGDPATISIAWLMTVARNRLVDVLRQQARRDRKRQLLVVSDTESHESTLAERLRVEAALDELSMDHRLVLTLHYMDGLTVPALADHLGRSVKSIEGLVTRARQQLRTKLDEGDGRES